MFHFIASVPISRHKMRQSGPILSEIIFTDSQNTIKEKCSLKKIKFDQISAKELRRNTQERGKAKKMYEVSLQN